MKMTVSVELNANNTKNLFALLENLINKAQQEANIGFDLCMGMTDEEIEKEFPDLKEKENKALEIQNNLLHIAHTLGLSHNDFLA